jgi:hypothetical protein
VGQKSPAGAGRRDEEERHGGQGMPHADVHVRGAGCGEIRAAERRGERGAPEEEAAEPRPAEKAEAGGEERCGGREDNRGRQLDSQRDREVERVSPAGDLAEEVVETLSRTRHALHEEKSRAIAGDPLREGAREAQHRPFLGQTLERAAEALAERLVARARVREELDERQRRERDRDERHNRSEDGWRKRSS